MNPSGIIFVPLTKNYSGCGPRIPSEALAEGGPAIPLFAISARVADQLFEIAGKQAAQVRSAIDRKPASDSFEIPLPS
jgi:hypothetical protein